MTGYVARRLNGAWTQILPPPATTTSPAPTAAFTTNVVSSTVSFDGSASTNAASWAWTYGDGSNGTGQTSSHTYTAGTYKATLTVKNTAGVTASTSTTVTIATSDTFTLGTTEPQNGTNVGVGLTSLGHIQPTVVYTGPLNPSGTVAIKDQIIEGIFQPAAGAVVTLTNCVVEELVTSTGTWSVLQTGTAKIIANFCEITTLTYDHNAQGFGLGGGTGANPLLQLNRCYIHDTVDGGDLTGAAWVKGCHIDQLLMITPDSNHSDNITHSDGIQILSGDGIQIVGNSIRSYASTAHSTASILATQNQALSCIMLTPNNGPITNLLVDRNWFYGGEIQINGGGLSRASGNSGTITNNRFKNDQYYLGHTVDLSSTAVGYFTVTGNVDMDTGAAITVRWNA